MEDQLYANEITSSINDIITKSCIKFDEIIDEFYVKKGILLDESHDGAHALAVMENAIKIYAVFKFTVSKFPKLSNALNALNRHYMVLIIVASMFHDVYDHKYITDESVIKAIKDRINDFIKTVSDNPPADAAIIFDTIDNMSWSKGISRQKNNIKHTPRSQLIFDIVQDADRVEAIGPIGVRRNYLYTKHKVCNDIEDLKVIRKFMIEHMIEKLVLIHPALNFDISKKMFQSRHDYTVSMLETLQNEEKNNEIGAATWEKITCPVKS
jgi:uncharacterized protein